MPADFRMTLLKSLGALAALVAVVAMLHPRAPDEASIPAGAAEGAIAPTSTPHLHAHSPSRLPSARLREQAEERAAREESSQPFGAGQDPSPSDPAVGENPDPES